MIVSLRPGHYFPIARSIPQRRRVVIIGATEAGVSAAFHLGEAALLLEQQGLEGATVTRWNPPNLGHAIDEFEPPSAALSDLLSELVNLTAAETRLGTRVTAIDVRERRVDVSNGESFVYDKLITTLPYAELQWLIADQLPSRIQTVQAWRFWLNGRDIELLDADTQRFYGDMDGQVAGKRVAAEIQRVLTMKYANKTTFQPRLVSRVS